MSAKILYGDEFVPLGFVGTNSIEASIEHSPKSISDYDYTTYRLTGSLHIKTLLRRRLISNALDICVVAGTYSGKLPLQKQYILDGSLSGFTPFGTFRTLRNRPITAEKYVAVFGEHNFRSLPFELIGLDWFAKKNIGLIVFSSAGKAWNGIQGSQKIQEWGGSVSGIFGLLRFDAAQNIKTKKFYLGLSAARLF